MAAVAVTTAGELDIVEAPPGGIHTGIANVAIAAGQLMHQDGTTGKWVLSDASTAAGIAGSYIATRSAPAGGQLTGMRNGVLRGFTLAGDYGSAVYASDTAGALDDAAGASALQVGMVIGQFGELRAVAPAKLLLVDIPLAGGEVSA